MLIQTFQTTVALECLLKTLKKVDKIISIFLWIGHDTKPEHLSATEQQNTSVDMVSKPLS